MFVSGMLSIDKRRFLIVVSGLLLTNNTILSVADVFIAFNFRILLYVYSLTKITQQFRVFFEISYIMSFKKLFFNIKSYNENDGMDISQALTVLASLNLFSACVFVSLFSYVSLFILFI